MKIVIANELILAKQFVQYLARGKPSSVSCCLPSIIKPFFFLLYSYPWKLWILLALLLAVLNDPVQPQFSDPVVFWNFVPTLHLTTFCLEIQLFTFYFLSFPATCPFLIAHLCLRSHCHLSFPVCSSRSAKI